MGENFFFNTSLGRFIFPAFPPPVPGPVRLRGASLLSPTLRRTLEMGVSGRQPGLDPAPSPWAPWPCWIMLALPSSRPHPQRGRKCPLTRPGPLPSWPLATGLMACEVRKPQTLGPGRGQTAKPSLSVGTSVARLPFLTAASTGWVNAGLAQASSCRASVSGDPVACHQEHVCLASFPPL